jgi:glycine oxidase
VGAKSVRVGIVGCGVVGAAIAYRLSKVPGMEVLVYDGRESDRLDATGAALGVLMAVSCAKLKGRHIKLRLESLTLFEELIPELGERTGIEIAYNRHGILQLFFDQAELDRWQTTQAVRQKKGFRLDIWSKEQLLEQFPELASAHSFEGNGAVVGAVFSPQDRQLNPAVLTQALIQGAVKNGAKFHFNAPVSEFRSQGLDGHQQVTHLHIPQDDVPVDWVVIAAGLGAMSLTQTLKQTIPIFPVLGQALQLKCLEPIRPNSPVITEGDVHVVPLNDRELWVGATVEYPQSEIDIAIEPNPQDLEQVRLRAIFLYPPLAGAEVIRTWQGLRPRPHERAAPVIERLPGYQNVLVAAGHYRNGVLLAPVTAERILTFLQSAL